MEQTYETRRLAGRAIAEMVAEIDPYASYQVFTGNPKYSEECNGARFVNGRADIAGLERDADPDDVDERVRQLQWFVNCEPVERALRTVEDGDGKRVPVYGWRLAYRLEKAGEEKAAKPKKEAATAA